MNDIKNSCYYCGEPKTSMEHVPPKVFFPNEKYTLSKTNHRQNLITVPSCDVHNSSKSHLDEYLFTVITINILSNEHGQNLGLNKTINKVIMRNPRLFKEMFKSAREVLVNEDKSGNLQSTFAFNVDIDMLDECFNHISRGIYYHHFQKIYEGNIRPRYQFIISLDIDSVEENEKLEKYRQFVENRLSSLPKHGHNPEIFYYRLIKEGSNKVFIQLSFYESIKIDLFFNEV